MKKIILMSRKKVSGDVTAPTLSTITIEDAAPTDVVMVFDEPVTGTNLGFTIGGTTSTTFASISGSGTTFTGVLAVSVVQSETVTLSYDSGTGDFADLSSNALASITNQSVTNNSTEVFPQDSAASLSDVDNTGSFYMENCTVSSISGGSQDGTYHIKMDSTSGFGKGRIDLTLVSGNSYDITIWVYKDAANVDSSYFTHWIGFDSWTDWQEITETSWTEYTWTLVANATTGTLRFEVAGGTTGQILYLDEMSVKDLGVV